jgi:signal transduction histidine kinase
MEEIGYLSGAIAHDFNNLLTGILGYATYLKTLVPEGSREYDAAACIEQSARRAAELTRRLLDCCHRGEPAFRPVGIDRVLEEAAGILSASVPGNVEVRANPGAPSAEVTGDADTLVRALLHLGTNAAEAMPGGGRVTLSSAPFVSDGNVAFDDVPVPAGDYVSIVVSDTGRGIPDSMREEVFAPFFTTKPEGEGAGLGLPMVSRCVRRHGGFLRVESAEGKGTSIEILLPARPSTA